MSDFEVKSYLGDYPFFDDSLFPIEIDGVIYEEEDAHIFISEGAPKIYQYQQALIISLLYHIL